MPAPPFLSYEFSLSFNFLNIREDICIAAASRIFCPRKSPCNICVIFERVRKAYRLFFRRLAGLRRTAIFKVQAAQLLQGKSLYSMLAQGSDE
jgi:hypothetical protein